jgi:hypothetical protein
MGRMRIAITILALAVAVPAADAEGASASGRHVALAEGGAFQYGVAAYQRILRPKGFVWDPEVEANVTGRGETIEGETLDATCHVRRGAVTGICTIDYWLSEARPGLSPASVFCPQKVRARNLGRQGSLAAARRHHEFVPRGTRIHGANAYSYHGYAITCDPEGPQRSEVVYAGDPE